MSLQNLPFSVVQFQNKRARIWAGIPYTKWIAGVELRHKEHNKDKWTVLNGKVKKKKEKKPDRN